MEFLLATGLYYLLENNNSLTGRGKKKGKKKGARRVPVKAGFKFGPPQRLPTKKPKVRKTNL